MNNLVSLTNQVNVLIPTMTMGTGTDGTGLGIRTGHHKHDVIENKNYMYMCTSLFIQDSETGLVSLLVIQCVG